MAQLIFFNIIIDGSFEVTPFNYLSVKQEINAHHSFELRFDDDLKKGNDSITISRYQSLLGKSISITFGQDAYEISKNQKDKIFKGIITEVTMSGGPTDAGSIVVRGYSPTILLDALENCSSHLEKNLSQIVSKVTTNVPSSDLKTSVQPRHSKTIPYVVQYNESDFAFLKRLAADYGEWFFYDGQELQFGKTSNIPEIELKYPQEISDLQFSIKAAPIELTKTSYSLKKQSDFFKYESKKKQADGLGSFGSSAAKVSSTLFPGRNLSPSAKGLSEQSDLDAHTANRKAAHASNLAVVHANCDHPGVHVGSIVNVVKDGGNLGKYLISSVNHVADGEGNYSNYFEAIPADVFAFPLPVLARPYVEPQIGVVMDNKDPEGKGRVKVMLAWQSFNDKGSIPWMQVMTPSAGSGGKGNENRGFHFTPEVNDHVIVGFTENDPARPFVMGSIPTDNVRNTKSNKDNFEKIIQTTSGNTIFFRDKSSSSDQEIRIETDTANYISILVKGGNGDIEVISSKTITVKSETINIEAKDIAMKANNSIEINANKSIKIGAMDIEVSASKALTAKGAQVSIQGSATTEVKANAQLNLQSSGQASLKGAIVMIN